MFRLIVLGLLLSSLSVKADEYDLYPEQIATCQTLADMASGIQKWRRINKGSRVTDYLAVHNEAGQVEEAMANKVYREIPEAVPPMAAALDLHGYCTSIYYEINKSRTNL